jgi:hypothetical protein
MFHAMWLGEVTIRQRDSGTDVVPNCIFPKNISLYPARMKKSELTPKQSSSVPCPTCGVAAGKRCVLINF